MRKYIYILFILFTISCDESSDITSKNIEISDFNQIYVNDIFDINLIQDSVCKIEIVAESNLIPELKFEVDENKILIITNNNTARWATNYNKPILNISIDTLWFITVNSPSKIKSQNTLITPELKIMSTAEYSDVDLNINCDNFYFACSETSGGKLYIEGITNNFTANQRGSYEINAESFISNYVYISQESIANCKVHVLKELTIEIFRSGFIYYKGDPYQIDFLNEKAKDQLVKLD
jgi:hypothetical protein